MASLPALIDSIVGPLDEPVTIRLSRYAYVRPIFANATTEASTEHDDDWLSRQLATPLVGDLCEAVRLSDCAAGTDAMVVGLSEATLEPDGRVRFIVRMLRANAIATRPDPLAAEFAVWLGRDSGSWHYDTYQVLEIT